MPVLAGTSGWQYRDWRGVLYPSGVPQRAWLEHYAARYPTVENNGSFTGCPAAIPLLPGGTRTPADFVMAVKASRYLTHIRRLRDPAEPAARFLAAATGLADRLGPVLLQLPPTLRGDRGALGDLDAVPARAGPAAGHPGRGGVPASVRWTEQTGSAGTSQAARCGLTAAAAAEPAVAHRGWSDRRCMRAARARGRGTAGRR